MIRFTLELLELTSRYTRSFLAAWNWSRFREEEINLLKLFVLARWSGLDPKTYVVEKGFVELCTFISGSSKYFIYYLNLEGASGKGKILFPCFYKKWYSHPYLAIDIAPKIIFWSTPQKKATFCCFIKRSQIYIFSNRGPEKTSQETGSQIIIRL